MVTAFLQHCVIFSDANKPAYFLTGRKLDGMQSTPRNKRNSQEKNVLFFSAAEPGQCSL